MSLHHSLGKEDLFDILSDLLNIPLLRGWIGQVFFFPTFLEFLQLYPDVQTQWWIKS